MVAWNINQCIFNHINHKKAKKEPFPLLLFLIDPPSPKGLCMNRSLYKCEKPPYRLFSVMWIVLILSVASSSCNAFFSSKYLFQETNTLWRLDEADDIGTTRNTYNTEGFCSDYANVCHIHIVNRDFFLQRLLSITIFLALEIKIYFYY